MEAIEYNREKRRWDFYELKIENGTLSVSEANPARCTRCHGTPLRPNWETYLLWPGAYGERDGFLSRDVGEYERFVLEAAKSPIYARLPGLREHYAFQDGTLDPNTRFTLTLTRRNMERIAAELAEAPAFPSIKFALAAAVTGCGTVANDRAQLDFLPESSDFRTRAEQLLSAKIAAARKLHGSAALPVDQYTLEAVLEAAGVPFDIANASTVFHWKDFVDRAASEDTSLDPFSNGFGGIELFADWGLAAVDRDVEALVAEVRAPYASLPGAGRTRAERLSMPFSKTPTAFHADIRRLCDTFTKRSREALRGFTPPSNRPALTPRTTPSHR